MTRFAELIGVIFIAMKNYETPWTELERVKKEYAEKMGAVKNFLNDLINADQILHKDNKNMMLVDGRYAKAARLLLEVIDQ